MSKLDQRLTLVANVAVVLGLVLLAIEVRENTRAVRAQTRDAMTEKQMVFSEWVATNPELAGVWVKAVEAGVEALTPTEQVMLAFFQHGSLRAWENEYYQFREGLFTEEEFSPRRARWRRNMAMPVWSDAWRATRETFAPTFRTELDEIVEELTLDPGR